VDCDLKPGIQIRANNKLRVQIRRNGTYQSKTFGSIRAAEDWQRVAEGKATAEEFVDQKTARRTTLAKACTWMIDGNHAGAGTNAKNIVSKLRYWQESRFASWALPAIHDWDLIRERLAPRLLALLYRRTGMDSRPFCRQRVFGGTGFQFLKPSSS
jgi:hypothetical protein